MTTRRRGFMLLELLAVLALLAAFSLVSARLFTGMMRQIRDTRAAQNGTAVFEQAVARLRADVRSADKVQGEGPTLILTRGPRVVTWAANPAGGLSRTETGGASGSGLTRRWENVPVVVSFGVEGGVVGVRVEQKGTADVIAMSSEAVALKGVAE